MNKPICYVGVDVGQAELWVAVADRRPRRFAHTAAGVRSLVRFCRQAAPDHVLHVCMEATGVYGRSLAVQLLEDGADLQVSIVNPAQIAAFGKVQLRRTKTDAVDAQVILAFARSQTPSPWTPEPVALRELNQLVKEAEVIQTTRTQWLNRQHAHSWNADQPAAVRRTASWCASKRPSTHCVSGIPSCAAGSPCCVPFPGWDVRVRFVCWPTDNSP